MVYLSALAATSKMVLFQHARTLQKGIFPPSQPSSQRPSVVYFQLLIHRWNGARAVLQIEPS